MGSRSHRLVPLPRHLHLKRQHSRCGGRAPFQEGRTPAETCVPVVTAPGAVCSRALIPVVRRRYESCQLSSPAHPRGQPSSQKKCRFAKILDSQPGLIPPRSQHPWEGTGHGTRPPKVPSKGDGTQVTLVGEEVGEKGQGERDLG